MYNDTTTELSVLRDRPSRFTWGRIIQIHDIGPYTIVEYREKNGPQAINYHVYVDGEDTCNSTVTLEGALLSAIARKHLEANEARYMALGACKLLGVKDVP